MNYRFVAALLSLVSGCVAPGQREREFLSLQVQAKSMCEIMADPDRYLGQRVTVRGTYELTPHQRVLVDGNCPKWEFAVALHKYIKNKEPARHSRVVYSGVFTSRRYISPYEGLDYYKYSLDDAQLLASSRLSESRQ